MEKKLQSLLRSGVVYREGDLIRNLTEKGKVLFRERILPRAAKNQYAHGALTAEEREEATGMDQSGGVGVGGNFLSREIDRFAGPEYGCFKIRASLSQDFFMAWKVQCVTAQFAGLGIWKRHAHTLALHDLADACRNLL